MRISTHLAEHDICKLCFVSVKLDPMLKYIESIPDALIKAVKSESQTDNLKLLSIIVEDEKISQSIQHGLDGYRIKEQSMLLVFGCYGIEDLGHIVFETVSGIRYILACVYREDLHSLIKVLVFHVKNCCTHGYPKSAYPRVYSFYTDVQAVLSR